MIFVVDDNYDDFFIVQKILNKLSYLGELRHFEDGEQLLDHLSEVETKKYPDLILLDVNMHKENGKTILSKLKASNKTKHLTIVMLSTSSHQKDIDECFRLQANGYIQKTIEIDKMSAKLSVILDEYNLRK